MALNWSALKNFIDTLAVKKTNDFLTAAAKKINAHDTSIATLDTSLAAKITGPASAVAGNLASLDATGKVLSDSGIAIEFGTHSNTLTGSTSGSATIDRNQGVYYKIGKMVYFQFRVRTSSKATLTGNMRLGLPFTTSSNASLPNPGDTSVYLTGVTETNATGVFMLTGQSNNYAEFQFIKSVSGTMTGGSVITNTHMADVILLQGTLIYVTDE
jgi:hypothetical protein